MRFAIGIGEPRLERLRSLPARHVAARYADTDGLTTRKTSTNDPGHITVTDYVAAFGTTS